MPDQLVSILMPAYNAAPWIAESLDSALAQTWPNTELIIVDDGSTDGTVSVVNRFLGPRVRLITQENQGQSAAENTALRAAQGDFIQYLDADDLLSPDKVERQMKRLAEEPGCLASGEWGRFYSAPRLARFLGERVWRDLTPSEWLIQSCEGGLPMMQAGIWLCPRSVLERAGPWDEQLSLINDFEYFARVLLASAGVKFCPGARLYYRSGNPDSLASRRGAAAFNSALRSVTRGTEHLLQHDGSPRAKRACADVFQTLMFYAYLEHDATVLAAEAHIRELGGSSVRMTGGLVFTLLRSVLGWKRAKRLQRRAYELGYAQIAAWRTRRRLAKQAHVMARGLP
jgi:glycosyltransferase involved in cell wall biosynthesis